MAIWTRELDLKALNAGSANTAISHLGIEFTEYGDDYVLARIHVDERTCQPYGILHGGVSVVLAETLGSMAAACSIPEGYRCVGLGVTANHVRAGRKGSWITATARPTHLGRTTHVWAVELRDEEGKLTCNCSLTMAILPPEAAKNVRLDAASLGGVQ